MNKEWIDFINQEVQKDYMIKLKSFLDQERQSKSVYPDSNLTFNYLTNCPYDRLKVIIVGDAPFTQGGNDGMAFSFIGHNPPEENSNIIYEAFRDYFGAWPNNIEVRKKLFPTTSLLEWAKQGVLLLNMTNTCTDKDRFAHRGMGWESFNIALLKMLNEYHLPLVIINKSGYNIKDYFNPKKHLYLDSNEVKWCSKANDFIRARKVPAVEQHYQLKINWTTLRTNV